MTEAQHARTREVLDLVTTISHAAAWPLGREMPPNLPDLLLLHRDARDRIQSEGPDVPDRDAVHDALGRELLAAPAPSAARCLLAALGLRNTLHDRRNWLEIGLDGRVLSARGLARLAFFAPTEEEADNPFVPIAGAIRLFLGGRASEAYAAFGAAATHPWFAPLVLDDWRGAETCRPLPTLDELWAQQEMAIPLPPIAWRTEAPATGGGPVLSYTADDIYFRAFAPDILGGIPRGTPPAPLHFHVVHPTGESLALATRLRDLAPAHGVELHLSTEHGPVWESAYYASARFLRLPEFLARFRRPIVQVDADSELLRDPRAWLPGFAPDTVGLLFSPAPRNEGYVPWRVWPAGLLHTPFNPAGLAFARVLRASLAALWDHHGYRNWWIDQTALWVTQRLLAERWGTRGFGVLRHEGGALRTDGPMKSQRLAACPPVAQAMAEGRSLRAALVHAQFTRDRTAP